jgi:hypothetical protein
VLRQDLATIWLLPADGPDAGVVARRYCRACAPSGPVTDVACAVCTDGPLLAGELAAAGGARHPVVSAWLGEQGWRRGSGAVGEGDGPLVCRRCAPVLAVSAWPISAGAEPERAPLPTQAVLPGPKAKPERVAEPAEGVGGGEGEWMLW